MNNKYNLDFYETMEVANGFLDKLEDDMASILQESKDDASLESALNSLKGDSETILHLEDMLNLYLESGDYQSVCNQLVMNELMYILIRDVLPDTDLDELSYYLESMKEEQLIDEVTKLIDKYNSIGDGMI